MYEDKFQQQNQINQLTNQPINHHPTMARIICIDYGGKRTGLAVTDPLQIIATALTTIETKELIPFLKKYFQQEQVEPVSYTHLTLPTN